MKDSIRATTLIGLECFGLLNHLWDGWKWGTIKNWHVFLKGSAIYWDVFVGKPPVWSMEMLGSGTWARTLFVGSWPNWPHFIQLIAVRPAVYIEAIVIFIEEGCKQRYVFRYPSLFPGSPGFTISFNCLFHSTCTIVFVEGVIMGIHGGCFLCEQGDLISERNSRIIMGLFHEYSINT